MYGGGTRERLRNHMGTPAFCQPWYFSRRNIGSNSFDFKSGKLNFAAFLLIWLRILSRLTLSNRESILESTGTRLVEAEVTEEHTLKNTTFFSMIKVPL